VNKKHLCGLWLLRSFVVTPSPQSRQEREEEQPIALKFGCKKKVKCTVENLINDCLPSLL
jgi:hypothetical protein